MAFKMKGFPLRDVEARQDKTRVETPHEVRAMSDLDTIQELAGIYSEDRDRLQAAELQQKRGDRLQATGRTLSGAGERSKAGQDFDRAFAQARKEGVETFMWRGEEYNTKLAGLE